MTQAFGVSAEARTLLPGGQGTTVRAGDLILKPVSDPVVATWIADTVEGLTPRGYRLPTPVRADTGQWIADGWCAWTAVAGEHGSSGRSREILTVARLLHDDLRHLPDPGFAHRDDVWARGDRAAWSQKPYEAAHPEIGRLIAQLEPLRVDEGLPDQVVHADLYGNVLFADREDPAVIDLSPYWRPAPWGLAVAVVDGLAWYEEDAGILELVDDLPHLQSLLARAAVFRLVTSDHYGTSADYVAEVVADFTPVVELICRGMPAAR